MPDELGPRAFISIKWIGGLARNRTGVQGFAVLCVATPPRGLSAQREPRTRGVLPKEPRRGQGHVTKIASKSCRGPKVVRGMSFVLCNRSSACYMPVRSRPTRSPIAQLVEHSTVNRIVAGSSPARGANSLQIARQCRQHKACARSMHLKRPCGTTAVGPRSFP